MTEVEALNSLLMFWIFFYFALLVIPLTFKFFGLGVVADPLIRLVNRAMLFPFWLAKRALIAGWRRSRSPRERAP